MSTKLPACIIWCLLWLALLNQRISGDTRPATRTYVSGSWVNISLNGLQSHVQRRRRPGLAFCVSSATRRTSRTLRADPSSLLKRHSGEEGLRCSLQAYAASCRCIDSTLESYEVTIHASEVYRTGKASAKKRPHPTLSRSFLQCPLVLRLSKASII